MAKRASVPKFGIWDSENIGYTVYFDKVREGKGGPPGQKPVNPNDPQENLSVNRPTRPTGESNTSERGHSSYGHAKTRAPQRPDPQRANQDHRRTGSNASTSSVESGKGRGEPSKFAPPPQYPQRSSNYQGQGNYGVSASRPQQVGPRVTSSPQRAAVPQARQRGSSVPKFGVWDEGNLAGDQGFTMQFDKVKRQKEVAKAKVPDVPPAHAPEKVPANDNDNSLVAKICRCLFPTVKE